MTERDSTEQELDLQVVRVLKKFTDTLFDYLKRDIDGYELSRETFQILELLYNKGPHSVQLISDIFSIPSGSITYVVDKLEKKGLVERTPIPGDRRKINITLTRQGHDYFADIFPKHLEAIKMGLSPATDDEKLELIRVAKKIGLALQQRAEPAKDE
ncbi:MarR family winged helix-turn-helix transcriptional regulator [Cohnella sp. JJ-181]|uniref:MarR family winged helix-turn-helix transcriptional regulator n=1 Tax=Cohnella rhizoplanae TaxID=2974897 RepID=UPI0022FF6B0C|nr:MarR family transcriptional regulator [Cohnella sp. JJ-181]CAI6084962.1 HTH-type transcriptional regulator MhqR [Cohnella sp. JJ-181]